MKKLSTEPYKGVRDFYPEDMFIQKHIFGVWRKVVESFGYEEYTASVLEPAELYKAKSGDEIVNEQTYTFTDRGDREVTLRPEMTPTVARMVAGRKRELGYPLRWYSIPNLFRYEQPQRGRVREHWQLNVDIFGADAMSAEKEMITIAVAVMEGFGVDKNQAKSKQYEIRINNRALVNELYRSLELDEAGAYKLSKLIDKKEKMPEETFIKGLNDIVGEKRAKKVSVILKSKSVNEYLGILGPVDNTALANTFAVFETFIRDMQKEFPQLVFSPSLMRGFDYYTGTVFEIFDTHEANRRSLFGGGRYDDLLGLFSDEKVSACGFGMGDVTIRDFLETHGLMPKYKPQTQLYICIPPETDVMKKQEIEASVQEVLKTLRKNGVNAALDISSKKIPEQIKTAIKLGIPFVTVIGADEVQKKSFSIKYLADGSESLVSFDDVGNSEQIQNILKK